MTTHTLASIRAAWAADGLGYSTDAWTPGTLDDLARALGLKEQRP